MSKKKIVGAKDGAATSVVIKKPRFEVAVLQIRGIAPYVQHRFSQKALNTMIETQEMGSRSKKGQTRPPKDFNEVYRNSMYISREGWHGMPANAFRKAMISACKVVNFKMTLAKLSLFIDADGFDKSDGTPLVRITKGEPHEHFAPARNDNGSTDVRCRPMWDEGWEASVRIRWDADQFSTSDTVNLMARVGLQVGIGEGRPDSKNSPGLGWGIFEIVGN